MAATRFDKRGAPKGKPASNENGGGVDNDNLGQWSDVNAINPLAFAALTPLEFDTTSNNSDAIQIEADRFNFNYYRNEGDNVLILNVKLGLDNVTPPGTEFNIGILRKSDDSVVISRRVIKSTANDEQINGRFYVASNEMPSEFYVAYQAVGAPSGTMDYHSFIAFVDRG